MRRYVKYIIASFVLLISVWMILLRAQYAGVVINHWTPTADMAFARAAACSALLPDGRVLVTGGNSSSGVVNTAELYGANGTFTLAAPMTQARAGAACVAMQDGRVLVAGGTDGVNSLASAELYDPAADTWTPMGAMAVARSGHTATLLPWGAVLIVGGQSNGAVSDVVELFLTNGQFLTVGKLSSPRTDYAVAVLPGRQVLIAGGSDGNSALNTIDLFDYNNNSITPAGTMLVARTNFAMAARLDGTVLITGGYGAKGTVLASTEVYDPVAQATTDGPQLPLSRADHHAYTLPNNGRVILVGGVTDGGQALTATDVFEPWTGKFASPATMNTARSGNTTSLLRRGGLIVAGGKNGSGYLTSSEVYGFATVATDKEDYNPGTAVVMSGSGWKPGENVLVQVTSFPLDQHNIEFTGAATADGTGAFKLGGFTVDKSHAGVKFLLTATGSASTAQTQFTDATYSTTTTLAANPTGPQAYGSSVSFYGSVTAGAIVPGAVGISVDGSPIGTCPLDASGLYGFGSAAPASCSFTSILPGVHSVVTYYPQQTDGGGNTFTASNSSSVGYTVNEITTTTSVGTSGSPSGIGQSVTFTATIDATGGVGFAGTVGGSVTFSSTNPVTTLGTIGVTSGAGTASAQLSTSSLPAGPHTITAQYSGVGTEFSSSNNTVGQTVSPATASIVVTTAETSPQPYGTTIHLTATVTSSYLIPTGTVAFYDNGTLISSGNALDGFGVATSSTSSLAVGAHTISAQYTSSSGNWSDQTVSTNAIMSITALTPTVTVTPTPGGTENFGTPETFTAVLTPGTTAFTGSVTFTDVTNGNAQVGAVQTVSADSAAVTVSNISAPTAHTIQATYTPNTTNFLTASGSTTYTTVKVAPVWTLVANPVSASDAVGQTITLTLSATPVGGTVPTGAVTLMWNGSNTGSAVILNAGSATFSYTPAASGTFTPGFGIYYNPSPADPNFTSPNTQNSLIASYTVNKASTTEAAGTSPASPITWGNPVTLTGTITSPASGTVAIGGNADFCVDSSICAGGSVISGGPFTVTNGSVTDALSVPLPALLSAGTHSLYVRYNGDSNYSGPSISPAYTLVVNPATSTTVVTAATGSIAMGAAITFTATVTISPAAVLNPAAGASVTFWTNGLTLSAACTPTTPANTNPATSTCAITNWNGTGNLLGGAQAITAVYSSGTANISGSNNNASPFNLAVAKATANLSSTLTLNPSATITYNQSGTSAVASVTGVGGGVAAPTGTVSFYDGLTLIGTASPSGTSTLSPLPNSVIQTIGTHTIAVSYGGDGNYLASSGNFAQATLTVNKATPTFGVITTPGGTVAYGASQSFSATVVSGAGTPTGTVTFTSNAITIGSGSLPAGSLTTNVTMLPQGPSPITVTYGGDADFNSITDSTHTITIGQAATTGSLATSPATNATFGQTVTLTASFSSANAGTLTGTVNFFDGATQLNAGPVTLSGGQASMTTSTLTPGPHTTLHAVYSGDTNFLGYTTGNISLTVASASTTTTIVPSAVTNSMAGSETLTVTVHPVSGAPNNPTGPLQINDSIAPGYTNICTLSSLTANGPNDSTASCTFNYDGTNGQGAGAHSYVAVYSGSSPNWAGSSSPAVGVSVGKANTTLSGLAALIGGVPQTTITYGSLVMLSAQMAPAAPTPAYVGHVQFILDPAGSNTLIRDVAICPPTGYSSPCTGATIGQALAANVLIPGGNHTIAANFLGDTNYNASSDPIVIQVNQANITTVGTFVVNGSPYTATYGGTMPISSVTLSAPSLATPTGTVTLTVGASQIGTALALSGGIATFTGQQLPASLNAGPTQGATFSYSGDSNYLPATAAAIVNVNKASLNSSSLATSGTPAAYGANVTFTLTLAPQTTVGAPTGTVNFYDNVVTLLNSTPVPVTNSYTASFSTSSLNPGAHPITAVYTDTSTNYNAPATAPGLTQNINSAPTTDTLQASTSNPALNTTVTYTVTVTGGPIAPVGSVIVSDTALPQAVCTIASLTPGSGNSSSGTCTVTYNNSDAAHGAGTHHLSAVYTPSGPNAAYWTVATTPVATITVGAANTTIALPVSSAGNAYTYGTSTTLTTTVTPTGGLPASPAFTGTVQFFDGGTPIGSPVLPNSTTGITPGVTVLLSGGTHNITAQFAGDANYTASALSANLAIVVAKATLTQGTNVTFVGNPFTAPYGGTITTNPATETITNIGAGAAAPTGTVTLTVSTNQIGSPVVLVAGGSSSVASITGLQLPAAIAAATYTNGLTFTYSGDGNYNSFQATGTLTVTQDTPPYTLTSSQNPSNFDQSVTFTMTLTAPAGMLGTPTGTVTFKDGATVLNPVATALVGGVASFSTTTLTSGAHNITAVYSGDTNYVTVTTSPALVQNVNSGNTTDTLVASTSNPALNTTVTYTVTVTGGPIAPVGSVIVSDTALPESVCTIASLTPGSGNSSSGTCTVTYNNSDAAHGAGTHHLSAVYTPSGVNAAYWTVATTPVATITVGAANTTIALPVSSATNAYTYGTSTTLTTTVTPTGGLPASPAFTGTVQFFDGGTPIGSPVLPNSTTGITPGVTVLLSGGTHNITAQFGGDANYTASALSANLAIVVAKATLTQGTNVTFVGNPFTAPYGGTITTNPATETITNIGAGAAAPTGTVTLTVSTNQIGSPVVLVAGGSSSVASITGLQLPAAIAAATYTNGLTFTYSGDGNYNSFQAAGTLTVTQDTPPYTLTSSQNPSAFNQSVRFTMTLTAPAGMLGTPTGTVTFMDGATALNPGGTALVAGVVSFTTTTLTPGAHNITAVYSGDTNYVTVTTSPALVQNVSSGNTTVVLTPSNYTPALNDTVTFTVTVSGGPSAPAGSVNVYDSADTVHALCTIGTLTAGIGSNSSGSCTVLYDNHSAIYGAGAHNISATYLPSSGTWTTATSATVGITVGKANVTVTAPVSSLGNSYTYGNLTNLVATVLPALPSPAYANAPPPVQFVDNGGTVLGAGVVCTAASTPIAACTAAGQAWLLSVNLPAGTHSITAQFLGDSNYNASLLSGATVITVAKATPVITAASWPTSAVFGGSLDTGTILVAAPGTSPSGVIPTGTAALTALSPPISIGVPGTLNGTGQTDIVATLPVALLVGTPNITITYSGDSNYNSTTLVKALNVTKLAINAVVTSSTIASLAGGSPVYGQPIILTVTLASLAGVPSAGTITFTDTTAPTTVCPSATVANSTATCTVSTLTVAAHTISVASFNDPNYSLGTVSTLGFNVIKDTTTTVLTSSVNPSIPGQSVTFTATVSLVSPGVSTLGGETMSFLNGASTLGTCSAQPVNSSGQATCTFIFPTAGVNNISAIYSGDANTLTSTGLLVQNVSKPQPTFTLSACITTSCPTPAVNVANYGQQITFTATLTPPTGGPVPTGNVQFNDGSTILGTSTLTIVGAPAGSAIATLSVPPGSATTPLLSGGLHQITVLYIPGGDPNYSAVNSATQPTPVIWDLQINQATPVVTLAVSYAAGTGAPVYGQPVTLTATVVAPSANLGIPTGTVTFYDAVTNQVGAIANLVLVSGVPTATITVTSLTVGGHSLTAKYNGDTNYVTQTSSASPLTVSIAQTTTVMTSPPTPTSIPYGQNVTLSAQVTPVSPGAGKLVGTISFYDGVVDAAHLLGTSGPVDSSGNGQIQVPAVLLTPGFHIAPPSATSIVGVHHIVAVYNGGGSLDPNFASSQSIAANNTLTITLAATTTSVVSSVTPTSVYSQPVTFTATVGIPGSFGVLPTGTATFMDGSTTLGSAPIANSGGSAVATLTLPNALGGLSLAVGNHSISVTYNGDVNYATSTTPSASPLVQTVVKANTTSVLSTTCSTSAGCVVGQPVTLTAAVTVNAPGVNAPIPGTTNPPTGTVQFFNGITVLGSAPASLLVTGGSTASPTYTATLTTTLPQGNLALTVVYSGDTSYATSTSAILTQGINTIAVNVVVTESQSSITYGTPVQFQVTVTPVNTSPPPVTGTMPIPTGLVTFYDGAVTLCGGVQLGGGSATCTTAGPMPIGSHGIGVSYTPTQDQTGNINFQPNVSSTIPLVVNKIPTSLSLSTSFTQGYAGQPITLTAQVQANPASGVPYAGGQVQFFDGSFVSVSNLLCTANLISGLAVCQPSINLVPGLHEIFATYVGDTYYTGSQSGYAAVTVMVASTTTQIFSSVNPSVVGQTVVFTITVGVTYPSTFGPNGQVQLWDNSVAIGNPVQANNGTFTITVPGLTPGTHNIYATFLANGSFGTSTSPTLTQIVNKAPTVTTLAALPVSSTASQQVALTAVVSVPAPGSGAPTGTVQFVDTTFNKILGSAPLTMIGGVYVATITTDQMVQSGAPQLLTATYSGDANFATSTSVAQGQTVFGSQISVTNAASYYTSNFAPDSWATAWGTNLSTSTLYATSTPLPTSLGGSTVQVTDAAGVQRLAALSFVSMGQINFMIPTNTAAGLATVTVTNAYGATASTIIVVSPTAPGLSSQNDSGTGLAAGQYTVVHADGSQTTPAQIAQYNAATGLYVPVPIVAAATDQVYLVLYGTGIRYKPSNASVTATVNGQSVPVAYAGPQGQYAGLDQVNLGPLPSFAGAGVVNVQITVNGEPSNTVTVDFQ